MCFLFLPCLFDTLWLTLLTMLNAEATPWAMERGLTGSMPAEAAKGVNGLCLQ